MSQSPNCSAGSQRQKSTARPNPTSRCTTVSPSSISTLSARVSVPGGGAAEGYSGLSKARDMEGLGIRDWGLGIE